MQGSPELDEVTGFLRRHPPFSALSAELLQQAASAMQISYHRRGTELLHIGDANTHLSIIRRGAIEAHDASGGLVMRLDEGECYGLPSLLTGKPVRHRVTLIEDGLILLLPLPAFQHLRNADPEFERYFMRTLEDRLAAATSHGRQNELLATPVGHLAQRAPIMVSPETSIAAAARHMSDAGVSSLLIGDSERLIGIVTDRDLRNRVLATGRSPDDAVSAIMTADPTLLDVERPVFEALLTMVERGIHHLPLTRNGRPAGMVTTRDLMTLQTQHPLYLMREVQKQTDVAGLQSVCRRMPKMFALLLANGTRAEDVCRMLTALTDAVTRRLLDLAAQQFGDAPMDFAWLAFGSQAREEQGPRTDQDNGLLLAAEPDAVATDYFAALADFVCDGLDACGYVHCPGNIMAKNPQWRQPLATWQRYFGEWMNAPEPDAVLKASIFFDQRCIAGSEQLADSLSAVLVAPGERGIFLGMLARQAISYDVPLGLFRRFVVEHRGEHRDTLDLKRSGALPINDLVRVRALEAGILTPGTLGRVDGLLRVGRINGGDAERLVGSFRLLARLRLQHQAEQLERGETPDNRIRPDALSRSDRDALRDAFLVVREAQTGLAGDFGLQ